MMDTENYDPALLGSYMNRGGMQDPSFMKFQLESERELEELKNDLLGYKLDDKGESYIRDDGKIQQINEKGANALLTYLKPRINKIFSLSNMDEEMINGRCLVFVNNLTFFLGRHQKDFDIMSFSATNQIIDLCDDMYYATIVKSLDGWEGDSIRKTHTTHETRSTLVDQSPKVPQENIGRGLGLFR